MKNIENLRNITKILNIVNFTKNQKLIKFSIRRLSNVNDSIEKECNIHIFNYLYSKISNNK